MDPRLAHALSRLPGWTKGSGSISELKGGITNSTYLVALSQERFVVRLGGVATDLLGIDRRWERQVTEAAAHADLGAQVVVCDPDDDLLITRFLPGESLTLDRAVGIIPALGAAIRRVHEIGPVPHRFSAFDMVRQYRRVAKNAGLTMPDAASKVLLFLGNLEPRLRPANEMLCHNDLLPANLIVSGEKIRIIDWEYAAMGDPFFDLGNFSVNLQFSSSQNQELLHAYFDGAVPPDAMARLTLMQAVSDAREGFWGFAKAALAAPEEEAEFRAYGEKHLDRFLAKAEESADSAFRSAFESLAGIPGRF